MTERIEALLAIVLEQPDAHEIRLLLAEQLSEAGRVVEAIPHYLELKRSGHLDVSGQASAARLALEHGLSDEARQLLEPDTPSSSPPGPGPLNEFEAKHDPALEASVGSPPDAFEAALDGPPIVQGDDFLDAALATITFADVGGLADVKTAVQRMIIDPLAKPELYATYGRSAGGGVLLYGPPGCGKTLVARAAAGEAGLPFYNVRIEDIVDPYFGVSEQRLVAAFEAARELRPCILFIDELDALGYARSNQRSERARSLVEVLLQQLDSAGSDNEGVLVLAASNEPWDIDGALLRPGRFDRTIFVPPPDAIARGAIIDRSLQRAPHDSIEVKRLVKAPNSSAERT